MKRIIYTCNRCKQEIKKDPVRFCSEISDRETEGFVYMDLYPVLEELDFCKNCADFFVDLIRRHCNKGVPALINKEFEKAVQEMVETVKDKPEEDNPPLKEKTRRKLDTGKIRALHNAGWTVKAIAEEMSCSEAAVYNALKNLGIPVGKRKAPEPESTEQSTTT